MIRLLAALLFFLAAPAFSADIPQLSLDGPVTPVKASYLHRGLAAAAAAAAPLVVLRIDTPGGLDESMRAMVKEIVASPVPVAAWVAPSGARAASAGAVVALACDFCAMAPGTAIGAAHPVSVGGEKSSPVMEEKIVNDAAAYARSLAARHGRNAGIAEAMVRRSLSLPAEQAVADGIADFLAGDAAGLLSGLEGRRFVRGEATHVLRLARSRVTPLPMTARETFLDAIGNPNVAYILMMLGVLGLFFELANPGVVLPGTIGAISLVLALFSFQTLPVNYAGLVLILLALVFFIAEIKIVSHGMLAVAGIVSMVIGSVMLFDAPEPYLRVSYAVIAAAVTLVALFCLLAVSLAVKAHRRRPVTGREGLVGECGTALTPLAPRGEVFVHGEHWKATASAPVAAGEEIEVIAVEGMVLKVVKREAPQ